MLNAVVLSDIPVGALQDSGALGWGCQLLTLAGEGRGEQEKVTGSWALPGLWARGRGSSCPAALAAQRGSGRHWGLRAVKCR